MRFVALGPGPARAIGVSFAGTGSIAYGRDCDGARGVAPAAGGYLLVTKGRCLDWNAAALTARLAQFDGRVPARSSRR